MLVFTGWYWRTIIRVAHVVFVLVMVCFLVMTLALAMTKKSVVMVVRLMMVGRIRRPNHWHGVVGQDVAFEALVCVIDPEEFVCQFSV